MRTFSQLFLRLILCIAVAAIAGLPLAAAPGNAAVGTPLEQRPAGSGDQNSSEADVANSGGGNPGSSQNPAADGNSGNNNGGRQPDSSGPYTLVDPQTLPTRLRNEYSALQSWLNDDAAARSVRNLATDILLLVAQHAAAGIPPALFQIRLREAAAKNIPASRVMASLEADAGNWRFIAEIDIPEDWLPEAKRNSFYLATAAALRNGMSEDQLRSAIQWAYGGAAAPERLAAAAVTAAGLLATSVEQAAQGLRLLRLLAASRLRTDRYLEVVALLQQALRRGLSVERALTIAEEILDGDSSISRLRSALVAE
ncbi:MAG: hypothetical protein KKC64_15045 [Spirochaetes bacterium]|nr:hypothetical protein [Spirochaetota bacterium]